MNSEIVTRRNFTFAWNKFARKEMMDNWNKDSFSYLKYIPLDILSGEDKKGLDVGCGSGVDMRNIARFGARIVGIDISDAINITKENIADFKNIYLIQADIHNLPFKDGSFDFVYCFGVLHHLPDPEKCFRILCSKVKKNGTVIIYVYEDFFNRTKLERALLKIVNSLRIITKIVPPYLLYFLSVMVTPFIFLSCSFPYQILKRLKVTKDIAERIPYRHTCNLNIIVSDLYDRFSVPIENRYSRDEVKAWFNNLNFEEVSIINYRGWVAWGKKR